MCDAVSPPKGNKNKAQQGHDRGNKRSVPSAPVEGHCCRPGLYRLVILSDLVGVRCAVGFVNCKSHAADPSRKLFIGSLTSKGTRAWRRLEGGRPQSTNSRPCRMHSLVFGVPLDSFIVRVTPRSWPEVVPWLIDSKGT